MKNKTPLVSVGIPTYNRPEGLRRTLECITGQTYRNLEIIVSDNCSPGDETEAVVREFMEGDPRIQYFRQDSNMGPAYNSKFVLEQATGKYFMWAADDDEWMPDFIEKCLNLFSSSNNLICVSCLVDRFESKESKKYLLSYDYYSNIGKNKYERLKEISSIVISGKKRVAILMHGIFYRNAIVNIKTRNQLGADLLYLIAMSEKGECSMVPQKKMIKYGHRKSIEEFIEYFEGYSSKNPYKDFTKTAISLIESMTITKWEKTKIRCFIWLTYFKYRIVFPRYLPYITSPYKSIKKLIVKKS